jgi:hypothetical protein
MAVGRLRVCELVVGKGWLSGNQSFPGGRLKLPNYQLWPPALWKSPALAVENRYIAKLLPKCRSLEKTLARCFVYPFLIK